MRIPIEAADLVRAECNEADVAYSDLIAWIVAQHYGVEMDNPIPKDKPETLDFESKQGVSQAS